MTQLDKTSHVVSYRIPRRPKLFIVKQLLILLGCLLSLFIIANVIVPQMSGASSFSGQILLGFNERYGPSNTNHLGVDIAWEAGSSLYAPATGTISYVGKVPAAAGTGKNVTAVTIRTDEGHQITLNPFASTSLKKDDTISKGQVMGTLSDTGDPSSIESHVHLSLRVDGIYRNPSHLIESVLGSATSPPTATASQPPVAGNTPEKPRVSPEPAQPSFIQEPSLQSAQLRAEGVGVQLQNHIYTVPTPTPLIHETFAEEGILSNKSLEPSYQPTTPAVISEIPGVGASELKAALVADANKTSEASFSLSNTLTKSQFAAILYAIGIIAPCALIGVVTIMKKIGLSPPPVMHLFAAREE